jgi:hypothetical protein
MASVRMALERGEPTEFEAVDGFVMAASRIE